jgi:hypothetical protein
MLGEDANDVSLEARRFIVQVGGYLLDRIAMGDKLCLPRDAGRTLGACQFIHRGIADLALHRFAILHHRECKRQALVVVSDDLATHERHENPHPFKAAVLRPDWLACRGSLSHCYPGDKKAIRLLDHNKSDYGITWFWNGPLRWNLPFMRARWNAAIRGEFLLCMGLFSIFLF